MASRSTRAFPEPNVLHPVRLADGQTHRGTVYLRAAIDHPRLEVGDYTYASSFDPPENWAARLAPYLFDFSPERLSIGRFCQIAHGALFITASANHRYDGFSSYPFAIFGGGPLEGRASMPGPGADTVVGNDVWIGHGAIILPGARIGDGVIIGSGAIVSGTVPPYSIISGDATRQRRRRFPESIVERLQAIAWWHWPIEEILKHEDAIVGSDLDALESASSLSED